MTKTITIRQNYNRDNSKFGGLIYFSDFNTDICGFSGQGSSYAQRIESDWKFDRQCRKNAEYRDRQKNYKKGNK